MLEIVYKDTKICKMVRLHPRTLPRVLGITPPPEILVGDHSNSLSPLQSEVYQFDWRRWFPTKHMQKTLKSQSFSFSCECVVHHD